MTGVLASVRRRIRLAGTKDDGSAVVEFVTLGVLLLVPVIYLVVTLGRVQAAVFAAEGAAREAARAFVVAAEEEQGAARAVAVVRVALLDQGFDDVDPGRAIEVECETQPCLQPENRVRVRVTVDVVLPGVPAFVDAVIPARVPVSAESVAVVDRFGG